MRYTKITISGKICTGKTTLFQDLQKQLKWPTFSTSQFFRDYAKSNKLSLNRGEEQNEKITKKIDLKIFKLLKKNNNLIVEGWMAGIMADKLPNVIRILLICDEKERIKRYAKRENIPIKNAQKRLYERENSWLKKIKKIYGRDDIFKPENYNCIIDTTNLKPQKILQKVMNKLQK